MRAACGFSHQGRSLGDGDGLAKSRREANELTSRHFFDDALTAADMVYAQAPYASERRCTARYDGDDIVRGGDQLLPNPTLGGCAAWRPLPARS